MDSTFRFPSGIRALGVGHVGDNPRALIVTLTAPPGDDDIRTLHDFLVWRPSAMDAEWCINMARQEDEAEIGAGLLARDPEPEFSHAVLTENAPGAVERLRDMAFRIRPFAATSAAVCDESADTIVTLTARVAELEAALIAIEEDGTEEHNAAVNLRQKVAALRLALAPFAKIEVPPDADDGTWVAKTVYCNDQVTAASVRRARAALAGTRAEGDSA